MFAFIGVICIAVYIYYLFRIHNGKAKNGEPWAIYQKKPAAVWLALGISFIFGEVTPIILFLFLLASVMFLIIYFGRLDLKHFKCFNPSETTDFTPINIHKDDWSKLGIDKEHKVNYIAKDADNEIYFPESTKPTQKYFITAITFTPKFETTQTVKGKSGRVFAGAALAGPLGAAIGATGKSKVKQTTTEKVTTAFLTLITTDYSTALTVRISCNTKLYNNLVSNYELDAISLAKIEAKIKKEAEGEA